MPFIKSVIREFRYLKNVLRTLFRIRRIKPNSHYLLIDDLEQSVDQYSDQIAFYDDQQKITYQTFEYYANQTANWAHAEGIRAGSTIALYLPNRWEYVAIWFGLSKLGIISALINNQLIGDALLHCINISKSDLIIIDSSLLKTYQKIEAQLIKKPKVWILGAEVKQTQNFEWAIQQQKTERPDRALRQKMTAKDKILKLFTSGTTGLPKVALITHMRAQNYMHAFSAMSKATKKDRMLMVLPLYHATGGLCGIGSVLTVGGSVIIRKEFSASKFWDEAVAYKASLFMYVGEICRFLTLAPPSENETKHHIRCMMGNGLRSEIWKRFINRFKIKNIIEFYGATEGNVSLVNVDGRIGAVGRIPFYLKHRFNVEIVKYDVEKDQLYKDKHGFCIKAGSDEIGEVIGEIKKTDSRFSFEGYGNKTDTNRKCLKNAFKKGDLWFRTGDLMKQDSLGYFYFIDRIGDTFRWKAENVATSEVEKVLLSVPGIEQAVVYGVLVPDTEGRAGMASIIAEPSIDLTIFISIVKSQLPMYSWPIFLRFQRKSETTATFKYQKNHLVKEGFNPDLTEDPIYYFEFENMHYNLLDKEVYQKIMDGKIHF